MQVIQQRRLLSRPVKLLLPDPLHVLLRQRLVLSAGRTFTIGVEPAVDRGWPRRMRVLGHATLRVPRRTPRAYTAYDLRTQCDRAKIAISNCRTWPLEAAFVLPALDAVGLDIVTIFAALELRHYLASVARLVGIPTSVAVYLRVPANAPRPNASRAGELSSTMRAPPTT
jgi:hypothetical protein